MAIDLGTSSPITTWSVVSTMSTRAEAMPAAARWLPAAGSPPMGSRAISLEFEIEVLPRKEAD